jgi:hypothetical protein
VRTRFGAVLLLVGAVIPVSVIVGAVPASAKGVKPAITCTVTGSATISPGVSETPQKQTLTVTTSLSGCTNSSVAGITGSSPTTTSATGKKPESCANLAEKSKPTKTDSTIDWNNGDTSADSYKTTLDAGSATVAGKITSGTFDKGKITGSLTYTVGAGQNCTSVPVTSATITGTFQIT